MDWRISIWWFGPIPKLNYHGNRKFIYKLKDIEFSEYDSILGFAIYSEKDLSKMKPFGLKYKETKEKLKRNRGRKVNITYKSLIILIILIIFSLIIK